MIVDEVKLLVSAGNGGDGHVSFRREKYEPRGGPDGGNGGDGGNVYIESVTDLTALKRFRFKNKLSAENGEKGKSKKRYGKKGEHFIIKVPVGTLIVDADSDKTWEIDTIDQRIRIARGGRGGRGNFEFRSSTDITPTKFEKGKPGQQYNLVFNLRFIADVGLIGLPSAGKSSLLNALTKTHVKVGAYPFTTLEANLGELHGIIIADIPGLIEGAHTGKGLGTKFLKHIQKTKLLVHCIDVMSEDVVKDYKAIRHELEEFSKELTHKNEMILLTKSDLVDDVFIKKQTATLKKYNKNVMSCSIIDDKSLAKLKKKLSVSKI